MDSEAETLASGSEALGPKTKDQVFIEELYGPNSIPHPPYSHGDGRLNIDQINPLIRNHTTKNYRGGPVIYKDGSLAESSTLMSLKLFKPTQLPEISELAQFSKTPRRTAVCLSEMRNGTGDIFEGVSLALSIARNNTNTTLVLPRDEISYSKATDIIESITEEIEDSGLVVVDYHQAHEDEPFDLAIYPSTQRHLGNLAAKTSILIKESGQNNPKVGLSWKSTDWGGITISINTGFNPNIDKYGAVGPIGKAIEYKISDLSKKERQLLDLIEQSKLDGQEIVIAYPGSNTETEAKEFIELYRDLIAPTNNTQRKPILALIPGEININARDLTTKKFNCLQIGIVRNAFISLLLKQHVSRNTPSLVTGSMSLAEAMHYGVPFFYKTELWKQGNADVQENLIKQAGLSAHSTQITKSSGMIGNSSILGSPVNLLSYSPIYSQEKTKTLSRLNQESASLAFGKLPSSLFGLYGFLDKIQEVNDPNQLRQKLKAIGKSKISPDKLV